MVNFNQLMKQAQTMQRKMQEMQEELSKAEYEGKAGGNMVCVTINGKMEMKKIEISPSLLKPEEKEILEDLIIAAYNDAVTKAELDSNSSMSNMASGMGIPPGFKLPF
ncbi:MAG: YbaB/EbfC family nucleoid-associated protein [Rickettsiaceae bacterium]|nr:YbaB/EbfC family nucleoid-associated protein [Rickettsiaceae bacterium]